eukprot:311829-Chlamydomonas_euryale.AAC.6
MLVPCDDRLSSAPVFFVTLTFGFTERCTFVSYGARLSAARLARLCRAAVATGGAAGSARGRARVAGADARAAVGPARRHFKQRDGAAAGPAGGHGGPRGVGFCVCGPIAQADR